MNAKGISHKASLEGLRSYLKTVHQDDFEFAVKRINRLDELATLWEAGLTMPQQKIVMARHEEILARRRG